MMLRRKDTPSPVSVVPDPTEWTAKRFLESVSLWQEHLTASSYSELTQAMYLDYLGKMFFAVRVSPGEFTEEQANAYIARVSRPSTKTQILKSMKSYFGWLHRRGYIAADPVAEILAPLRPDAEPKPLPRETIEAMIEAAGKRDARRRAAIEVLYLTGTRVGALALAVPADYDAANNTLAWKHAKSRRGRGEYASTLGTRAKAAVETLLILRDQRQPYLVGASKGTIQGWVRQAARDVGVDASAHRLRHSFVTHLIEEGADVRTVSKMAGHRSLETTVRYADVAQGREQAAANLLDPRVREPSPTS
jgi:site-specific recombinase XerD